MISFINEIYCRVSVLEKIIVRQVYLTGNTAWLKDCVFLNSVMLKIALFHECIMTYFTKCVQQKFCLLNKVREKTETANCRLESCKLAKIKIGFCSLTSVLLCFRQDVEKWLVQCERGHLNFRSSRPDVQYVLNVSFD